MRWVWPKPICHDMCHSPCLWIQCDLGGVSIYRCCLTSMGIPIIMTVLSLRWKITIPEKTVFILWWGPGVICSPGLHGSWLFIVMDCRMLGTKPRQNGSRVVQVFTLRPRQNGRHFADDLCKRILLNKIFEFPLIFHCSFILKCPIDNI